MLYYYIIIYYSHINYYNIENIFYFPFHLINNSGVLLVNFVFTIVTADRVYLWRVAKV